MIQTQAFFGDSDEHVSANRYPYLRFDGVLAGAKERLDSQVLLDPFEEQFDLPALAVKIADQLGFEGEVVGQKADAFASLVAHNNAAQRCRIVEAGVVPFEDASLIAQNRCVDSIHGMRIAPYELRIALGTGDEESLCLVNSKEPREIQITAIHQIKSCCFDGQLVQQVDLVGLAVGDPNEAGDSAVQVQQRVQLDSGLGSSKRSPRKHRQTQIDGGGVQRVNRRLQIDTQWLAGVKRPSDADQVLRKVGIDLPGARCVGVGQRVSRNRLASKSQMVQTLGLRPQIDLDIAKRLAVGQLREGHRQELIETGEIVHLVIASVGGHAAPKSTQWQMGHELSKNEFAMMHVGPKRKGAKEPNSEPQRSNRDQNQTSIYANNSSTYTTSM